ncbi:MAG: hypothetical protein Q4B73_06815 [Lachnospiraceae bacterium]|nr:hypothetical protein [Lachnospiraceae bacterium]
MRHSHRKYQKRRLRIQLILLLLAALLLVIGGSYAAYVSRSYVKGVAATPRYGFGLYSDYLSVVFKDADERTYPDKKIPLTKKAQDDTSAYKVSFIISNTADGTVSTKRMQYYLKMSNLPEGAVVTSSGDITAAVTSAGGYQAPVMKAYTKSTHVYTITIPAASLATAADIVVTAIPDADSDNSGYILAGRLQPSIIGSVAEFSYGYGFTDTGDVKDFAAFNFEMYVNNAAEDHLMTLSWDNTKVEIDPLFLEKMHLSPGNTGSISLVMSDAEDYHLIQFYRLPDAQINSWNDMAIAVTPVDTAP